MKYTLGRTNASLLILVTALFMLFSLPTQAKDYTQAIGTIFCDGGVRGIATHIQSLQDFDPNQSVIVTAAHVIYDPKTDQLLTSAITDRKINDLAALILKPFLFIATL